MKTRMKIIDKYVAKNFLTGYAIALAVLLGLRVIIDLFVNIDEFTENSSAGLYGVLNQIITYYGLQLTLYFRDFSGIITVVAAVFSLGKMTRSNELIAIMASGVSLKRVIAPILILALIFTGVFVVDQEIIMPAIADRLVRSHDAVLDKLTYDVWFLSDSRGSLFCSNSFVVRSGVLEKPKIILRSEVKPMQWIVTGIIDADSAIWDEDNKCWQLENGVLLKVRRTGSSGPAENIAYYPSDLRPKDIPVRRKGQNMDLMSSIDLMKLARQNPKDLPRLYAQKNFRITDPILNLVLLLISLPILVCREPKAMKSAILISFAVTCGCYILSYICKMMATEAVFNRVIPELWAWLPIFIFVPVAFVELDSMKT